MCATCAGNLKGRRDCSVNAGKLTKAAVSSATADLFNACRSLQPDPKKQSGGWLCPVPEPAQGEEDNYSKNCKHAAFSSVASVRKHFWAEHWDFGVWERKPRPLRTSSIKKLKCVFKFEAFTLEELEELDEHVLAGRRGCVPFKFHRIEELPVRDKTGHATELQAATAYSLLCPMRYPRGPTGERLSLYRSSSVTWCWMGGGLDSNVNIQTFCLNILVHTYSCTFLYLNPWSPIP